MDIKYEIIHLRVNATRDAQRRSRLAFLAITIVSIAMIISAWNAYLSWDRHFLTSIIFPQPGVNDSETSQTDSLVIAMEITKWAHQQVVAEFAKTQIISVPLLGIRVSISDAAILGSIGLFVMCIWFVLSLRRENHTIALLLRDSQKEARAIREYIFHGISSYLVFTDIGNNDYPIGHLTKEPQREKPTLAIKGIFKLLVFLPLIAVLFIIMMDIGTIFWIETAFRHPHKPLIEHFSNNPNTWEFIKAGLFEFTGVIIAILIAVLCRRALNFERATANILREYARRLEEEDDKIKSINLSKKSHL